MTSAIFDNAPFGYFSFFDDGTLHIVNETLCSLLGYTKEELAHKNVESIFTLSTRIFFQTHFFPLVKMHGHAEEIFVSLLASTGSHVPVLLNAKREEPEGKAFTSCAFIVVANRKKFEDELIAARKQAENALRENTLLLKAKAELQIQTEQLDTQIHMVNKQNHELKQLNHVITHSLKEPLRKILLYTEKLATHSLPAEVVGNLNKLVNASTQMRNIVAGLQQYVWLNDAPLQFKTIELHKLIERARGQLLSESKSQELVLNFQELPSIEGDEEQLFLLFYHLFSNAVKFKKEEKAYVSVRAFLMQQNSFIAIEDKYQYEDFIKLEITDKGIGFEPSFAEAVFELFKKLHATEGIGLGLALCTKIVANHFGVIKAESKINEGTTFTIILPVSQQFHRPFTKAKAQF